MSLISMYKHYGLGSEQSMSSGEQEVAPERVEVEKLNKMAEENLEQGMSAGLRRA